jgi:DNA-binding NarL/FixJ family response regulator
MDKLLESCEQESSAGIVENVNAMDVTIVLTHSYAIYLQGLRLLLAEPEDFRVIAEATEGFKAIQLARALHPDILVVDLPMSDLSGLEIARRIRRHAPATHVVLLSTYAHEAHVVAALRSGVAAYVLK